MDLTSYIRNVPDFPKRGIVFRDVTTLLKDAEAFHEAVDRLYERFRNDAITTVVGIESRGFVLGAALAYRLGAGFVLARKPGKLPGATLRQEYQLEYGTDALEIHADAIRRGDRVLLHDDLLATGGTMQAACGLVERLGGTIVALSFLIELAFLDPRLRLSGYEIVSLITYTRE